MIVAKKSLLEVENLTWIKDGKKILDIPAMQIDQGDHIALIGSNGSGKSSLLKLLSFLEKPTTGEVLLRSVNRKSSMIEKRRKIAVVFQEPLLLNLSVYDNIAYGLKIRGRKKGREAIVEEWMERLKIGHLKERYPRHLSGGEAQRVSIARAMALEPELLFLDEPFSALDAPTKNQLLEDISLIIKKSNMTTLFITHDFSEIPFLADKIFVLADGQMVQKGTVEEIFYRPSCSAVAALVGADNEWSGRIEKRCEREKQILIKLDQGIKMKVPFTEAYQFFAEGQTVTVFARSDDLSWGRGACNNYEGFVSKVAPYGWHYKVTVNCAIPVTVVMDKHTFLQRKPEIGDKAEVHILPEKIHMIGK
ncbi:ABC transporter ATP-binding protein [Heliorestis convoluta]|uniref:Sulfate/molybdate ABC transporter family protein n=1 Tax=Heliorestis convoluta TaxID=356322 RepID=A0A5Q2N8R3_9FIRM|nr:ABC transporter ATP-binding protein [Heliorestis convoluta]QGG48640.1 Putative Sulfate/molybdate ABC transporter family protein [Heliorestis convoluta]